MSTVPENPTLNHSTLLACVVALLCQAVSTLATAADPARDRARSSRQLARADTDHNGVLSRSEAARGAPRLAAQFDAIDSNRDGQLSPQEIRAWSRSRQPARGGRSSLEQHFARADADGNGLLSREEAEKHLPRVAAKFGRVDANRDGMITLPEMQDYLHHKRGVRLPKT